MQDFEGVSQEYPVLQTKQVNPLRFWQIAQFLSKVEHSFFIRVNSTSANAGVIRGISIDTIGEAKVIL